jgi:hypothetical protein
LPTRFSKHWLHGQISRMSMPACRVPTASPILLNAGNRVSAGIGSLRLRAPIPAAAHHSERTTAKAGATGTFTNRGDQCPQGGFQEWIVGHFQPPRRQRINAVPVLNATRLRTGWQPNGHRQFGSDIRTAVTAERRPAPHFISATVFFVPEPSALSSAKAGDYWSSRPQRRVAEYGQFSFFGRQCVVW